MTRKRSSPLGLELVVSAMLIFMLLPLLTQAAPLQDATEIQQYTEGCYYNYNHYNEGDRILTNEPCLNCTCHNKMLMCYLRVCPFTKPIGHDCTVEKREDQCCPIITCPEVPVDIAHHAPEPGTELSIPEKYGCSIEEKFYPEGAQVPSNPNKPCELCYCIKNRTSCLMQECTLHIDGCQPIYNKGSCCPVRYNCDHENDVLELEDHSTSTTTTVRPTPGFVLTTTMSPAVTTDCIHNGERHADGSSITGKSSCEHCYCMRGDIVCAVQECDMPMLDRNGKSCRPLPASEGQCCPSNYVCEDDSATTQIIEVTTQAFIKEQAEFTTTFAPEKDLHGSVSQEDIKLQQHIDEDAQLSTDEPERDDEIKPVADDELGSGDFGTEAEIDVDHTTVAAVTAGVIDRKHEVLPAETTLEPFIKIEDKIDQATESGIALDQTTVSADTGDEKIALAVDHTTELTDTTGEFDKKHEGPAVAMDHTTASADTTDKADKKDEEAMDHTTLPAATTGDLDKKHGEPAIDLDQTTVFPDTTGDLDKKHEEPTIAVEHTTVSADRTSETDKPDEEFAIGLDQTTVSADTTGKVDTKHEEPAITEPADTTAAVDKKVEDSVSDLDHTTISSDTIGEVDTKHEEPAVTVLAETTGEVDKKVEELDSDLDHTTVSSDTIGKVDKKDQKPDIDFDQTTVSSETTGEIDRKHVEHVTALDRTTISPDTAMDLDKKQDAIPIVTEKETDEFGTTSVPEIQIVDRIDHTTVAGTAFDHPVTPADAFSEIEKKPEEQLTITEKEPTAKDTTTAPSIEIEDKIDSTTVSDESSVSIEDEETIPATSAPAEVPKKSVEETSEEEEVIGATTIKPKTTEELEKKHALESVSEKIPQLSGETTTDKVEIDEEKLETTTAKSENIPQIDEEGVSTEKISTLAEIPEKPVQIPPIKTEEKTQTTLAPSEIADKFGSITDEVEESGATTIASPTKGEPDITVTTPSAILDESEEEETTSSEEKDVDHKTTAKPLAAEELTTSATLSASSVQQDEKDIREETTIGFYETTESSDLLTSQTAEKTTKGPAITEEVSSEKVFVMEKIPIVIPGEGDCLVGQKTYSNNSVVPNSDICEMSCKCISSVVVCQTVKCDIQNMKKCVLDESSKGCCPTFICDGEKIDTTQIPIQISTTTEGTPKDVSEKDSTTTTPAKDMDETATFTPTDIDMPAASTEEPMSHIKDEVEEHETTNILKIDLLPITSETPSVISQKPVSKPDDTKLEAAPVTEETIAAHTVVPTLSEKPISGATEDVIEIDTTAPKAVIDEEETIDESLSHTTAPSVEDEKITETIIPSDIDVEKEILSQTTTSATDIEKVTEIPTVAPTIAEKDKVSGEEPLAPITKTEDEIKLHAEKEAEDVTEVGTVVPSIKDEEKEAIDEPLAHTIIPPHDETATAGIIKATTEAHTAPPTVEGDEEETPTSTVSPISADEYEITVAQTVSPSVEDKKTQTFDVHTIKPFVEGEKDAEDHTVKIDVSEGEVDSQTAAPGIELGKETATLSSVAPFEDEEKEPIDETTSQSITPANETEEKQTTDESLAHTIAPILEDGKPVQTDVDGSEEKAEEDIGAHTVAPSVGDEKKESADGEKKPIDDSISVTVAPTEISSIVPTVAPSLAVEDKKPFDDTLEHTIAPIIESEMEGEDVTKSSLPSIGDEESLSHTVAPTSAEKIEIDDHTIAISVESDKKKPVDETLTHTATPVIQDEKDKIETTEGLGDKLKKPMEESTAHSTTLAEEDTESTEDLAQEHFTVSSIKGQEQETATKTTITTPTTKDEDKESVDESLGDTTTLSVEDEKSIDEKLDHTDPPLTGSDTRIGETTNAQTGTPISGEDKETKTPSKQEEVEDKDHTDSPLSESDKRIDETTKAQTVTPISGADEDHTDSPLSGSDKEIDESTKTQTVTPISDEEYETNAPSKQEEIEDEDHTDSPLSGSDKRIDETTKAQTVTPISGEDEDHTDSPLSGSDKEIDDFAKTQTVTPISDEEKETKAPSKQEEIEDGVRSQTELPSTADKEKEPGDESLAHTIAPHIEKGETTEDVTKVYSPALEKGKEKDEGHREVPSVLTHGEAAIEAALDSAHIDEDESSEEEDESEEDTHTAIPPVDDSDESTETAEPSVEDKLKESVKPAPESGEDAETVTKAPTVEGDQKEVVDMQTTSVPVKSEMEDKEKEAIDRTSTPASFDESLTHTIAPHVEEETTEDASKAQTLAPSIKGDEVKITDEHFGYTSAPDIVKETEGFTKVPTAAPSIKDEDKKLDESLAHVSTPSTEYEKVTDAPSIQDEKAEDITKSPDADVGQETNDETLAPSDATTSKSVEESEDDTKAHTLAPAVGIDESLAHTDSPVIVAEKSTVATTTKDDHTTIPTTEEEIRVEDTIKDHTVSSIEGEEKTDKNLETISPAAEDKIDIEAQTSIPSMEVPEKKPIDESLAHTILPSSEKEKETAEVSKAHTVTPLIENEDKDFVKHTTVSTTGTEASTVVPSIKDEEPIDESLAQTISPVKEVEKETENISKFATTIPSVGDKEKETGATKIEDTKDTEDYTVSPIVEIEKQTNASTIEDNEKEIVDTSLGATIAPSTEEKHETEANTIVPAVEISDKDSHTVTPLVEKEDDGITEAHTVAPGGQKSYETTDETFSSTIGTFVEGDKETEDVRKSTAAPSIKEEETEFLAHTIAPIVESESGTVAPSAELDESMAQTIAPTAEDKKELDNVTKTPLDVSEEDERQTVSPVGEKKPSDETTTPLVEIIKPEEAAKVPVIEEKVEAAHTVAPMGSEKESDISEEDHTVSPQEDTEKETNHIVTAIVEDESLSQSTVSTILGEKETEEVTTAKSAEKESIDETSAHTVAPAIGVEKVESIEPSKEGEEKEPISHTTTSAIEGEKETEIVTVASAETEQATRAPSVLPSLESVEESEESVESEEEQSTEGSGPKIQHIGEFVTERIEEAVTELSHKIDDTIKYDEVEASGEEGEDMEDVEVDVKKIISSTPKPVEGTETPTAIESDEEQTTSKGKDEITEPTQKPLEVITSETVPLEVGIAVTTPEHKITEGVQTAEEQTEANVAEKVTLSPQAQDIPTLIHTGIGITEESATEKTESSEESDEQKEGDEQKGITESSASAEDVEADTQATTTSHPLFEQHTTSTYLPPLFDERIDTTANISETAKEPAALTTTTTTSAPTVQYPNAPSPAYGGQPPQYPSYPEDEYTDEDETEVFGPGTCRYGGKLFVSAQQIPRDDPCDFCFCFRSDIICLQQSCPPPISGCHEEPISGFCCPRYECPVSMATVLNITTSTTTTSTTLPPHFLHHAYQGAAEKNGCHINGKSYQVGEKIDSTSGPCMHCTCGGDGQMKCDPKTCSPEPMLRQMIASVASRRR